MNEKEVLKVLYEVNAVITESHIVYTSGKHGTAYVNKDVIYPHTTAISRLCLSVAANFIEDAVETVVAPALGGIILSQWIAHHLTEMCGHEVLAAYAEKDGDGFVFKRGYDKRVAGRRVLVAEDVLNTGGSAKKIIDLVRSVGGEVVGLGVLCDRGNVLSDMGVPRSIALLRLTLDTWNEEDCPLCKRGVPVNTDVGKGYEFLLRKK